MDRIHTKRVYLKPEAKDGKRVLVDRLWPRGISKEEAKVDAWIKDVAPSDELRKWFKHDPLRWDEFKKRYFEELIYNPEAVISLIKEMDDVATLVYAAKDESHNNAVALREFLHQH